MSLVAYEHVILTNHRLTNRDLDKINELVAELIARRDIIDTRSLMETEESSPLMTAVFGTERTFELDFRPATLIERYKE